MTTSDVNPAWFVSKGLDPVSKVHRLTELVCCCTGAEHCRLVVFVPNSMEASSFEKSDVRTLEMTHENSFAWQTCNKQGAYHFIDNNVRPDYEKSMYEEFRGFPRCASLFAWAVPSQTAEHHIWGALIMGHSMPDHFNMERVGIICMILDEFLKNTRLSFLTDLVQTISILQRTHEAIPFVDTIRRFLKNHVALPSVSMAMLNAEKDKAAMFADREVRDEVTSFQVSPQTLLSQTMANDTDAPTEVKIPSMIPALEANVPSDVQILLHVERVLSSSVLAVPLRKPITSSSSSAPMMLTLSLVPDHPSPTDRCQGMLYFKAHSRVLHGFLPCIASLAPIFANILSQKMDIAKEIERIVHHIQPQDNSSCATPEKKEFLEKFRSMNQAIQDTKRREWKMEKPVLKNLRLTSVISQRRKRAVLKGFVSGTAVAVKIVPCSQLNTCPSLFRRELQISRSVNHLNIVNTLDHKINVSGRQILDCCTCTCPNIQPCPRHQIEASLTSIMEKRGVAQSLWDLLIIEFYDETLSHLIHDLKLFALPRNRPSTGYRCVDWKVGSCWKARVTLTMMLELAEALKYLHSIGIVFGDLNPENVFIKIQSMLPSSEDTRRSVKLGDFGSSCVEGYDRVRSDCTPAYCPPEFLTLQTGPRLHQDGCNRDVYSYGVTMWEMVMGKKPFSMFNSFQLQNWLERDRRCPFCDGFPHELRNLINRCWHQNPRERPSFGVIVEELKAILGSIE